MKIAWLLREPSAFTFAGGGGNIIRIRITQQVPMWNRCAHRVRNTFFKHKHCPFDCTQVRPCCWASERFLCFGYRTADCRLTPRMVVGIDKLAPWKVWNACVQSREHFARTHTQTSQTGPLGPFDAHGTPPDRRRHKPHTSKALLLLGFLAPSFSARPATAGLAAFFATLGIPKRIHCKI